MFAAFAIESPEMLSSMHILPDWMDFYSAKLDDASPAHEQKLLAQKKDALATIKQYDRDQLDREGQLSYDTLTYYLQIQVDGAAFDKYNFPVNQMQGMQVRCRTSWSRCTW